MTSVIACAEERIRWEFAAALEALEEASEDQRPEATRRLNRALRSLYDFVGYGKLSSYETKDTSENTALD